MFNPLFVHIADATSLILQGEELWLPLSESDDLGPRTEVVEVAGVYFDVIGYSKEREALLVEPIVIDGAAENIEQEMVEFDA